MLFGKFSSRRVSALQGKRFLHSIRLQNLLSYGNEGVSLDLEPLNVLIGPNASGKSNLIEAISLLAAAPRNLLTPFREGGGVVEWLWKGHESSGEAASLIVDFQGLETPSHYRLDFTAEDLKFRLLVEEVGYLPHDGNPPRPDFEPVYLYTGGHRSVYRKRDEENRIYEFRQDNVSSEQSVLSQSRGPAYPDLTYISSHFERFTFFRDLNLGRSTSLRRPQAADLPGDFLLEDASNLALVLNDLQHRPATRRLLMEKLRLFYGGVEDVTTKVQGGTIQVFFHEEGLRTPVPATRLSDGTLRYLCLLAVLCHPEPPPLICIEEPELGLHPDILPTIADLLVDAAQRTQLIVTTHSESLVSKLSGIPESVVVCDREPEGTRLRRLDPAQLQDWLEKYQLGQLWSMGEIGGTRW
jgi:predicted ATPase